MSFIVNQSLKPCQFISKKNILLTCLFDGPTGIDRATSWLEDISLLHFNNKYGYTVLEW